MSLSPSHTEHLARFRIPPELLELAGVRSISDGEARELFGVNGSHSGENLSGILFASLSPITGCRTGGRVKLDHPLVDGGKYFSEPGCRHLFFPPGASESLRDAAVTAVIVESEKAGLALRAMCDRTNTRLLPISCGGCWGFRRTIGRRPLPDGGTEPEKGPSPDLDLVAWPTRKTIIALDSNASSNPAVRAARRELAKELKERGADIYIAELPEGTNGPDDLLAERGDGAMLGVLAAAAQLGAPLRTDGGNAERFAREHVDSIRYCADQRTWHVWDGSKWQRDALGEIMRKARETAARMWDEVRSATDDDHKKQLSRWALHADSRAGLENMVALARFHESLEVSRFGEVFDRDPLLLNCTNGILDLRTGELRPFQREAMLTRMAGVAYNPRARFPHFLEFLLQTFGDASLIDYVQRLAGYILSGLTSEQAIFIFFGPTQTGKSTFVKILRGLLGEYATSLPDGALLLRKFRDSDDDHDCADLPGIRLATAVETAPGRKLNEAKIKQFTGQDPVRTRHLYENSFEFMPQSKLIIATNHLPVVHANDDAIWRRIKPVEFSRQVPKSKVVRDLDKELLAAEGPGILNWAVEGTHLWLADGLQEPERVSDAAKAYRREQDEAADWLEECCVRETAASTTAKDLYASYRGWAKQGGIPEKAQMSKTRFGLELKRLEGLESDTRGGTRTWLGIRLRA
jgi:P4 family phage/plasmid primase-like protien